MNGISRQAVKGVLSLAGALALGACLQGPWDYAPEDKPLFRGLWAQAYVVADRPITDICFERMLGLNEVQTPAFAFYDSAEVGVQGLFTDGARTMLLRPKPLRPNCFVGDTASLAIKGEAYALRARFVWDSAGSQVVSVLSATSRIADSFALKRTAMAPSVAFIGGFGAGGTLLSPENLAKLPPKIFAQFTGEFSRELRTLDSLNQAGDSAALNAFFLGDGKGSAGPGARMNARLVQLLKADQLPYAEGDTLFYISNADLNTLSHSFTSLRGEGVHGALITQSWDTTASRVVNPFQTFFGQKPKPRDFYYPGDRHRLLFFPEGENSQRGFNFLDSIGVVNTWFFTGRNRLYFYSCDTGYASFLATNTNAGDSPENNPKLVAASNITGGKGFWAAMAVDSFDVFIKADPADQPYPLPETRAAYCADEGWFGSKDCIDYYREWCFSKDWDHPACRVDAVRACLETGWNLDTLDGLCGDTARVKQDSLPILTEAARSYCIENGYPDAAEECAAVKRECESAEGSNACKERLWKICDVRDWALPACRNGMVTYCRDKKPRAAALCKAAAQLCEETPKPTTCL